MNQQRGLIVAQFHRNILLAVVYSLITPFLSPWNILNSLSILLSLGLELPPLLPLA
jgi:hypothetical protein